jgi:quinol monooxygenase YgiN
VTVEYQVELDRRVEFLAAIRDLGKIRRRDGAIFWEVFEDAAKPGRYLETYLSESWLEHLREHERVSRDDQRVQEHLRKFHVGDAIVRHYIGGAPGNPIRSAGQSSDDR